MLLLHSRRRCISRGDRCFQIWWCLLVISEVKLHFDRRIEVLPSQNMEDFLDICVPKWFLPHYSFGFLYHSQVIPTEEVVLETKSGDEGQRKRSASFSFHSSSSDSAKQNDETEGELKRIRFQQTVTTKGELILTSADSLHTEFLSTL